MDDSFLTVLFLQSGLKLNHWDQLLDYGDVFGRDLISDLDGDLFDNDSSVENSKNKDLPGATELEETTDIGEKQLPGFFHLNNAIDYGRDIRVEDTLNNLSQIERDTYYY